VEVVALLSQGRTDTAQCGLFTHKSVPVIFEPPCITNKMQRYTILFITVNALHVSGGFSAHRQELKTVHTASGICQACLLLPLAWVSWNSPRLAVAASKQA